MGLTVTLLKTAVNGPVTSLIPAQHPPAPSRVTTVHRHHEGEPPGPGSSSRGSETMYPTKRTISSTTVVLSSLLVLGTTASPAAARQDPGQVITREEQPTPPPDEGTSPSSGSAHSSCDATTSPATVPAPAWVSVR
jgi:hypothetical protein